MNLKIGDYCHTAEMSREQLEWTVEQFGKSGASTSCWDIKVPNADLLLWDHISAYHTKEQRWHDKRRNVTGLLQAAYEDHRMNMIARNGNDGAAYNDDSGKPSWDDAPEWAEWLAQDSDGCWLWYERDVYHDHEEWIEKKGCNGMVLDCGTTPVQGDWRNTLERRPTEALDGNDNTTKAPGYTEEEEEAWRAKEAFMQEKWEQSVDSRASREQMQQLVDAMTKKPEPDYVNHPPHYQSDNGVECIDAIRAALGREGFIAHCRGTAMKYIYRAGQKGDALKCLSKARWYLDRAVEEMGK